MMGCGLAQQTTEDTQCPDLLLVPQTSPLAVKGSNVQLHSFYCCEEFLPLLPHA